MFKQRCAPGWMPAQCERRTAVVHRVAPFEALRARSIRVCAVKQLDSVNEGAALSLSVRTHSHRSLVVA
jgi:hypothetical protein